MTAAQRHCRPHMRIPEKMQALEKTAVPAGSRRNLHVAVFMRKGWQPVVKVLTGSDYPSMKPLQEYAKADTTTPERLTAQEYIKLLEEALPQLTKRGEDVKVAVLHDKATPHTAKKTKQWAAQYKAGPLQLMLLPTDSPDLTPLDSHYWGVVKHKLATAQAQGSLDWDATCCAALKIMAETPVDPHIDDVPLRLKACVSSSGWCIDQDLKKLKQARKEQQVAAGKRQIAQPQQRKSARKKARRQ